MINTIDNTLNLAYKRCTYLQEAEDFGESLNGATYHILIKALKRKNTIVVAYHLPNITCDFCKMEKATKEPFIWIK